VNVADYELIDLFNWQDIVKVMISQLEFVRMVDVQTETIERYLREGKIAPERENEQSIFNIILWKDIHDVVLAYEDKNPIGCASFKFYDKGIAEVKRVFIKKEYRGKGVSKDIMTLLEKRAKEKGFHKLVLETGAPLVEALVLYYKMGYKVIENYGQYKDMEDSICMQKYI
jgi:putative acetyltransferase